jgi:putative nucleotidyltransferase with HDIG domain
MAALSLCGSRSRSIAARASSLEVGVAFIAASLLRFDLMLPVACSSCAASPRRLLLLQPQAPAQQMLVAGTLAGLAAPLVYAPDGGFEGRLDLARPLRGLGRTCSPASAAALARRACSRASFHEPARARDGPRLARALLDLTDLEQPLLTKMAAEAPGSWEHARAMANLAEAASAAIGADALLTRVGAYYHDLGKTVQPKYFVENLARRASPHEELEPDVSADAIMAHVVMGTKILRDGKHPEPVVEFAYTHHGTQVVEYFWHKCQASGNPKGLTEDYFRYPGMKPQTKETAILMLVDSIEAASRTIDPPSTRSSRR